MDLTALPTLATYTAAKRLAGSFEPSEQIRIENVLVEERVPTAGLKLYSNYVGNNPVPDLDEWNSQHKDFVIDEVEIAAHDHKEPWTFRPENISNHLPVVDRRLILVRVESAEWPCKLNGTPFEVVRTHIEAMSSPDKHKAEAANNFLVRFLATWNEKRDKRPLFATLELEIDDILQDPSPAWAEALRDRLGLGHYSPIAGAAPIPIFLMHYPLQVVYDAHADLGAPTIPTMLDGALNDFFFPSPVPGVNGDQNPCLGHALNLKAITDENDYQLGIELLHKCIDYRPEHFFRAGMIAAPFTMPVMRARQFHLPWLRLVRDRDDFGNGVLA
jgi:hypothetical protein